MAHDPLHPPIAPNQATVDAALNAQREALGLGLATGIGANAVNYKANAPGGHIFQKGLGNALTGTEMSPGPGGKPNVRIGSFSVITGFAPLPVGYVPPEFYGLPPDVYERIVGGRIPAGETLGFHPDESRIIVYNALKYADEINDRVRPPLPAQGGALAGNTIRGAPTGDITAQEYIFLTKLPKGFSPAQELIPYFAPKFETEFSKKELEQALFEASHRWTTSGWQKLQPASPPPRTSAPPEAIAALADQVSSNVLSILESVANKITQAPATVFQSAKANTDP